MKIHHATIAQCIEFNCLKEKTMAGEAEKSPLKMIAEHFGVNVSSVSRALSGVRGVGEKRRREICDYAASIGYAPDLFRRKRKNAIGLMMFCRKPGLFDDNYQRDFVSMASNALFEEGFHAHLEFLERVPDAWPSFLSNGRVDGVLVSGHPPLEICERLRNSGIPSVLFSDTLERSGSFCVRPDISTGTVEAVKRLVALGHKKIAYVSSAREFPTVEQRFKAFCYALLDCGLQPDNSLMIFDKTANISGGRAGTDELLEKGAKPTAIIYTNDYMAMGGMMSLLEKGFKLPEDISIAAHDNSDICTDLQPELASVDMDFSGLVKSALELLKVQLEDEFYKPFEKVTKAVFIERASIASVKN